MHIMYATRGRMKMQNSQAQDKSTLYKYIYIYIYDTHRVEYDQMTCRVGEKPVVHRHTRNSFRSNPPHPFTESLRFRLDITYVPKYACIHITPVNVLHYNTTAVQLVF